MTDQEDDELTRVVPRTATPADEDEDDHTRVVERSAAPVSDDDEDDHTRVVERGKPDVEDDQTFVVPRGKATGTKNSKAAETPASPAAPPTRAGRRRGIAPPPVPVDFAPRAVAAAGPGTVQEYTPRDVELPPTNPALPAEGPAATRAQAPSMPSVDKRASRNARVALVSFIFACAGAVAGATALLWVLVLR